MNVERLHRILLEVINEYDTYDILIKLIEVRDNLQNQVNQPQQPTYQQNLVIALKNLYDSLSASKFNEFSPSWNEIISEVSNNLNFGNGLKEQIENIFASNKITPAAALEEISDIVTKNEKFKSSIDTLITSFDNLKIGAEELDAGECELAYTIPRLFVDNKLRSLNKEIAELNFILNNISEAVTGEKQDFDVKTISSSDFLINVLIGIHVAKVLSGVVEKLVDNYKKILEIKKLRNELKLVGVPEKETKGIEDHANSLMEKAIKKIAQQIMKEYPTNDPQRKNELSNGVTIALNKIANRIDNGFNIEIRVKELPEPDEEDEITDDIEEKNEMINIIKANAKVMEFIKTSGQPILQLPENNDEKKMK